jgi:hypothetical protein
MHKNIKINLKKSVNIIFFYFNYYNYKIYFGVNSILNCIIMNIILDSVK